MKQKKILISSMGGPGSVHLAQTLLGDNGNNYRIYGSHFSQYLLRRAPLDDLFIVPRAMNEIEYVDAHKEIISRHKIDLFIPNSDAEAEIAARYEHEFDCHVLLPNRKLVAGLQDKLCLARILSAAELPVAKNVELSSRDRLEDAFSMVNGGERVWLRSRFGSGSAAATWVRTARQAGHWIDLWHELHGVQPEHFILAEYLPGRDLWMGTLWQEGRLCVAKIFQTIRYLSAEGSISGASSSFEVAKSIDDVDSIQVGVQAIEAVHKHFGVKPHGALYLDMKCNSNDIACPTEMHAGRFPMSSLVFDRTGQYCLSSLYVRMALDKSFKVPKHGIDSEPGIYFLRSIDMPMRFVRQKDLDELKKIGIHPAAQY